MFRIFCHVKQFALGSLFFVSMIVLSLSLSSCQQKKSKPHTVIVGTIAGPETQLMQTAKQVAKQRYGLTIKIVPFSDYNTPNAALVDGSLDANAFQTVSYFLSQIKEHGYKIVSVGKTFLYPMGIYSHRIQKLSALKSGATVGIPNDPSNEARALLLLQSAKLIHLSQKPDLYVTPLNILSNWKHLKFIALDSAELARALNSVSIAVINTNYAIPAGLSPSKNALFTEGVHSSSDYGNIIAARQDNAHLKKIKELVAAYQSTPVLKEAKKLFSDGAVPEFKPSH